MVIQVRGITYRNMNTKSVYHPFLNRSQSLNHLFIQMKKSNKTYTVEIKSNFSGHHHSFVVSQGQANQIMHLCGAEIEKSRYETPKGSLSAFL